jgi:hypothetical protein
MASDSYTKYLERLRAKDPSVLLGSLVWYNVAESVRVPHKDLTMALQATGLEEFVPPVPRDEDVFLRVCTSHERKRIETDDPEVFENYLMRALAKSKGTAAKQIVVEQVNAVGRKLSYEPTVHLEFNGTTIVVSSLTSPPNPQAMNLADLITRDFKRERKCVAAYTLRSLFRDAIGSLGATRTVPSGGVYFVMEKHRYTLDALARLSKTIEGTTFHTVPLINDENQQAMLRDAIEGETRSTIEKALDEIDRLLKGPEITAARYQSLVEQMNIVKGRTSEYAELLDDALAGCDLLVGSYDAKMRKLFMHVGGA